MAFEITYKKSVAKDLALAQCYWQLAKEVGRVGNPPHCRAATRHEFFTVFILKLFSL
ncbi:MAG: hypothetical protein ABSE73_00510 [Planctomycetota bacterium]